MVAASGAVFSFVVIEIHPVPENKDSPENTRGKALLVLPPRGHFRNDKDLDSRNLDMILAGRLIFARRGLDSRCRDDDIGITTFRGR
jgi:hypothetical protein